MEDTLFPVIPTRYAASSLSSSRRAESTSTFAVHVATTANRSRTGGMIRERQQKPGVYCGLLGSRGSPNVTSGRIRICKQANASKAVRSDSCISLRFALLWATDDALYISLSLSLSVVVCDFSLRSVSPLRGWTSHWRNSRPLSYTRSDCAKAWSPPCGRIPMRSNPHSYDTTVQRNTRNRTKSEV